MKPNTIISIVALLISGYFSIWIFNHFHAWLGIAFGIITIGGAVAFINNKIKLT